MKHIKNLIGYFTKITTGIVLISCIAFKLSGAEKCSTDTLWQIPLLGFLTALISEIVLTDKECSRRESIIRFVLHFVLISATVLIMGALIGWYEPSVPACLVMLLYVALVTAFSYGTSYLSSKKSADELNKALERRKNGK